MSSCPRTLSQHHIDMMSAAVPESEGSLEQDVYGFCDSQGTFHSFEGPDGKKMVMAMKALEEKVLAQVEKSLVGMRQTIHENTIKSDAGSWMLRNIVEEQKDFLAEQQEQSSRIDELSAEAFESRSDLIAQLDELAREALESRSDLIARTEEISQETFDARVESLTSFLDLDNKIDASMRMKDSESLATPLEHDIAEQAMGPRAGNPELELLDKQKARITDLLEGLEAAGNPELESLETHRVNISDLLEGLEDQIKVTNLLAKLQDASSETLCGGDAAPEKEQTALDLDLSEHCHSSTLKESENVSTRIPWSAFSTEEISYSSKNTFNMMPAPVSTTFNVHRPRPIARMTSSQSVPLLAPLF